MRFHSLFFATALALLAACSPADVPPIGEPVNRTNGLEGSWAIDQVLQYEISAEERGFPAFVTSQDITNAVPDYSFTDFQITFSGDQVTTVLGEAPVDLVEGQGTWEVESQASEAVSALGIRPAETLLIRIEGETYRWRFGSLANLLDEEPVLILESFSTDDTGEPMIRYEYRFRKQ